MERWDQGNVILVSSQDTATALRCPGGTVSSRVVALVCCTRTQITMQISSPGPAAAGRLHPPLHLRGDESRGVAGNVFREMDMARACSNSTVGDYY